MFDIETQEVSKRKSETIPTSQRVPIEPQFPNDIAWNVIFDCLFGFPLGSLQKLVKLLRVKFLQVENESIGRVLQGLCLFVGLTYLFHSN